MSNIVKGSGLLYTTGVPNTIPSTAHDSEFAIDINGNQYAWNRTTSVWDNLGQGIEIATSSIAPTHVPTKFRPRFVITPQRKLYFYSGSWGQVNAPDGLYTAVSNYYPSIAVDVATSGGPPTYYVYLNQNGATDGQALVWSDVATDWVPGTVGGTSGPTGIYSGSGIVPASTTVSLAGKFYINYPDDASCVNVGNAGVSLSNRTGDAYITFDDSGILVDNFLNSLGIQYAADYSSTIKTNDRSIPDVGTVKLIARPYKVYTALLSQSGTDDPIATVLENTLSGTPVWSRVSDGNYIATLTDEFTSGKTMIIAYPTMYIEGPTDIYSFQPVPGDTDFITIQTYLNYEFSDGILGSYNQNIVEIRVYP